METAKEKVLRLLLSEDQEHKDFYAKLLDKYGNDNIDMTPISPLYMDNVDEKNKIVITEVAYKRLLAIMYLTEKDNKGITFLIVGEQDPNGTILFKSVYSSEQQVDKSITPSDNKSHVDDFLDEIKKDKDNTNKRIICYGKTHEKMKFSDNFYFKDLVSYIKVLDVYPSLSSEEVGTIGMIMTTSQNLNFFMYDDFKDGFYTYPDVKLKVTYGEKLCELPAYKKGDYIIDKEEIKKK